MFDIVLKYYRSIILGHALWSREQSGLYERVARVWLAGDIEN